MRKQKCYRWISFANQPSMSICGAAEKGAMTIFTALFLTSSLCEPAKRSNPTPVYLPAESKLSQLTQVAWFSPPALISLFFGPCNLVISFDVAYSVRCGRSAFASISPLTYGVHSAQPAFHRCNHCNIKFITQHSILLNGKSRNKWGTAQKAWMDWCRFVCARSWHPFRVPTILLNFKIK